MPEFLNLTRMLLANGVHDRYNLVATDKIMDLIVENYVTNPGHTQPQQLRHALGLVSRGLQYL